MPNPENTEESKLYVAKVAEQLEEKDTQISVNAISNEEESLAVANAEPGGNVELSAGMSQLGASVNSENDNANNATDDLVAPAAVENTSSGQVASMENQSAGGEDLGAGNSMDEGDEMVLPAAKTEEEAEDTGEVAEPDTDELSAAADNSGASATASSAQSTLQNIISNVHVEEGRSAAADDGDATAIRTVNNSDDGGDPTAARTENSSGETTSSAETGAPNERTAAQVQFENLLDPDQQTSQPDPNAAQETAEFNAGQEVGLSIGRSAGYGEVLTITNGVTSTSSFKDAGYKDGLNEFTTKNHADCTKDKTAKYTSGYYVGYSKGFAEGRRLKLEVAKQKQAQMEQNPAYQEGKRMGIEAGKKSVSKTPEDKARSAELLALADSYVPDPNLPKEADPSPEALKNKGFYAGYNKGRADAKKAEIDTKKAADAALLTNPEYRSGYDFGYNLGLNGMSSAQAEERDKLMNQKNDKGETTLAAKGVSAGYNKGHSDKVKADNALRANREKDLGNDNHFVMGTAIGTLSAALKLSNINDERTIAINILSGSASMSTYISSPITIKPEVYDLFKKQQLHKQAMSGEQQAKYDRGYFTSYNKGTSQYKKKLQQEQDAKISADDGYLRGKALGEVAGSAASIRDELKRKLSGLAAKRMRENPANESPGAEEQEISAKIDLITTNILDIRLAVEGSKDDMYRRGYYEHYNKAYDKENKGRAFAKKTRRENQGGASAQNANSSEYQQGLTIGLKMGEMIFKLRKMPAEKRGDLDKRIEKIFEEAKKKGPDFEGGFLQGYNKNVMTGGQVKKEPKLSNDKTLRDNAWTAVKNLAGNNADLKKMHSKTSKEVEKEWFEYSKTNEKKGINPQDEYKKHSKDEKTKVAFIKSHWKEAEKAKDNEILTTYWKIYENAYNLGKSIGSKLGGNFLEGYNTAMSGRENANPSDKPYYNEGYKAGKKEVGFQNLSGSVLNALGLGNKEWNEKQALNANGATFVSAYNKHFNSWHKIFLISKGIAVPENLKDAPLDLISETKEEEKDVDTDKPKQAEEVAETLGDYAIAEQQISGKAEILAAILNNLVKNSQEKPKAEYLAEYKNGYLSAIANAEKKVNEFIEKEGMRQKGFLAGYAQSKAEFPEGALNEDQIMFIEAVKKGMEATELLNNSTYQLGKTEGFQHGMQVLNGLKPGESLTEKLASPVLDNIQKIAKKAGKTEGDAYIKAMLGAEEVASEIKRAEDSDAYKNIGPENQQQFIETYNREIELARVYINGYRSAANIIENDDVNDDYEFVSGDEGDAEFEAQFQKGYLEGRSATLISDKSGTENAQNLQRNTALNNKLEAMREVMGVVYADTYKIGWTKGKIKGKTLDSAAMISLKSEISQNGAPEMAKDVWAQFEKIVKAFMTSSVESAKKKGENVNQQMERYAALNSMKDDALKVVDDAAIVSKDKIEKLKEIAETAFEAIGNPLEDDRETFKELRKEGRKMFRELPEAFNEGYSTALESGMRTAANEKAAAKPSLADDFYNAMLAAISNKSKPDYVKGYADAGKMLDDMNRNGNMPTEDEMKMSLQLLPNFVRKRLLEVIEAEYKEFSKINPDKSKTEQLREHKERKNNYKNILSSFNESIPETAGNKPMDEFLKVQMEHIIDELSGLTAEMPDSTASFFEEKIENSWSKSIENYKKGFETAHPFEVKGILEKRGGTSTISQGITNFLDALHEMIEEGSIEDADIGDIDLLQQQEEFIEQSQQLRAEADEQENELTKLNNYISSLRQEINDAKNENSNFDALKESAEDQDMLDRLSQSMEGNKSDINDKEFEVFDREADVKILNEGIDENAKELMDSTGEAMGFKAPANAFAQFRTYILAAMGRLNLVGKYKEKGANSSVKGGGKLNLNDAEDSIRFEGDISAGLGDMDIKSSSLEIYNREYFVELGPGKLKMPIPGMNGDKPETIVFKELDLEMGISMIDQLDEQLGLEEKFKKGNKLGNSKLSGAKG